MVPQKMEAQKRSHLILNNHPIYLSNKKIKNSMLKLKHFVVNDFGVNAFVIYDETGDAVIIDGAVNSEYEISKLFDFINNTGLDLKYILNTHGHLDHICGNSYLKSQYNIPILMNSNDNFLVETAMSQAAMYGFRMEMPPKADRTINEEDIIKFGNSELIAIHVPGHSPGSIAFYNPESNVVFTGDALFAGSIGRTDLPGGNHQQLLNSISEKLFVLPADTLVFPGHGPQTSIREEKKHNPFF